MNRTPVKNLCRLLLAFSGLFCHYHIIAQPSVEKHSTLLYGIFNNASTLETRIVPIFNSVGEASEQNQVPGFQIPEEKFIRSVDDWYGSASLAGDPGTGQFFYANKSVESPVIWRLSGAGEHARLKAPANNLHGHCFNKMAMGPDGYVYAISTRLNNVAFLENKETLIVRFKPAGNDKSGNIEIVGYISNKNGYHNVLTYSGDMAFSANGDLFVFGTELDTTINYYKGAHIYKIASNDLKRVKNTVAIPINYIGEISGMGVQTGIDSTVITGVAFQKDGSFVLSAVDKYTTTRVHFYRGTTLSNTTKVSPVNLGYDLPPGFVISDLASFSHPVITVTQHKNPVKGKTAAKIPDNDWEKSVTITRSSY